MTVADVLEQIGHPLGRRSRTSCPLHQGSNPDAFWYSDHGWHCFSGCGKGSVRDLRERLGLVSVAAPPPPVITLLGAVGFDKVPAPRPSKMLTEAVAAHVEERAMVACRLHREAEGLARQIGQLLGIGRRCPEMQGVLSREIEDHVVPSMRALYDRAHRVLGRAHCACPW